MTTSPDPQPAAPAPPLARLLNPAFMANPYPLYAMLRSSNPVLRAPIPNDDGPGVWLLTRHRDVRTALKDGRFSVDRRQADIVRKNADRVPAELLGDGGGLRSMLLMDPPDHTRVRGLVSKAFTPRRVAGLRPRIEALVDELLGAVAGAGRMDLVRDLAEPLPCIVIAELLGVPPEDHRRFKQWSSDLISNFLPVSPLDALPRFQQALKVLLDYLSGIIAERRREPRDDLISAMIEAQEERDALSDSELLATCNLLLVAGFETTTNLIGNGTLALLRHPDEWRRLRDEPALLESGVEELLRYDSPVQATVRVTTAPVEIDGHAIGSRALVACGIGAANRDPEAFEDPDRLDVGRADNHHLSLGFGAHFCLGAPLARLEAEVTFRALLERCPELRLETESLTHRPNPILRGLTSLPVEF